MNAFLKFFRPISRIKHAERRGWRAIGVQGPVDTIGTHSLGAALIGWVLGTRAGLTETTMLKLIKMLLLHDLVMAYVPDHIPNDTHYDEKRHIENSVGEQLLGAVPEEVRGEFTRLFTEYQDEDTPLSQFARQCDKLDTLFQALIYSEELNCDVLTQFVDSYKDKFAHPTTRCGNALFEELKTTAAKLSRAGSQS